jgi:hypothetical protein
VGFQPAARKTGSFVQDWREKWNVLVVQTLRAYSPAHGGLARSMPYVVITAPTE